MPADPAETHPFRNEGPNPASPSDTNQKQEATESRNFGQAPTKSLSAAKQRPPDALADTELPGAPAANDASSTELKLPCRFGDYDLLAELGKGGMGVVYKARQRSANRLVALKLIRPDQLSRYLPEERLQVLARFRNEVQAAAQLEHDHVVTVYDVGEIDGQSYYAMRLVDGESLKDRLDNGPLEPEVAARYMEQIARALAEAHARGILHRDLKPHNVMLDIKTDRALLADFGLAKLGDGDQQLTASSSALGSPPYMSPEQTLDSGKVTTASDIYGLGATLYHLLTGRPPFQAANALATMYQVQTKDAVSPRELNLAVPLDLETICLKCLEKEPSRRYTTALELADRLARVQRGDPIPERPISRLERTRRWCRKNPVLAALTTAVVSLLILGTIVSTYFGWRASTEAARANLRTGEAKKSEREARQAEGEARRAEAEARKETAKLAFTNGLAKYDSHQLREAESHLLRAWASLESDDPLEPAYRQVLWDRISNRSLPLTAVPIRHKSRCASACFSPDGKWVLTTGNMEARLWDAETGRPIGQPMRHRSPEERTKARTDEWKKLVDSGKLKRETADLDLAKFEYWENQRGSSVLFAPDGKTILNNSEYELRLFESPTGRQIGDQWPQFMAGAWAFNPQDSRLLAVHFAANHAYLSYVDIEQRKFGGQQAPLDRLVEEIRFSSTGAHFVTISRKFLPAPNPPTAKHQYWECYAQIWESLERKIGDLIPNAKYAVFSKDGSQVATFGVGPKALVWNCATGAQVRELLQSAKDAEVIAVSPDFTQVVTQDSSGWGTKFQVYDAANGNELGILKHDERVSCLQFSPDGKFLITGSRDQSARIWDTRTWNLVRDPLRHDHGVAPGGGVTSDFDVIVFSPDGKKFLTKVNEAVHVWHWPPPEPTAVKVPLLDRKVGFSFAADYSCVAVVTQNRQVQVWDLSTGSQIGKSIQVVEPVNSLLLSPDKTHVVVLADNKIRIANTTTGAFVGPAIPEPDAIRHLALNSQNTRLLVQSSKSAQLWDTETGAAIGEPNVDSVTIAKTVFTPDGSRFVSGSYQKGARIWSAATGKPLTPVLPSFSGIQTVGVSHDGSTVIWAGVDSYLRRADALTGELLEPEMRHDGAIMHAIFSPDDSQIASTAIDKTVRLWDAKTGLPCCSPILFNEYVDKIAYSPDGTRLLVHFVASGSKFFDPTTGTLLAVLPTSKLRPVGFTPDGKSLVGTMADNAPCRWDAPSLSPERNDALRTFGLWTQLTTDEKGNVRRLTYEEWLKLWDGADRDPAE